MDVDDFPGGNACSAPSSCTTPGGLCGGRTSPPQYTPPHSNDAVHVCAGLNGCKGLGRDQSGTMPGDGKCATAEHICHTHNDCRGQGGCGYEGTPTEQWYPGGQQCNTWGSCATPINVSRISTLGANKGKSTWERAREVFEQRMKAAGREFAEAPFQGAPDDYVPKYVIQPQVGSSGLCNTPEKAYEEIGYRARLRLAKARNKGG